MIETIESAQHFLTRYRDRIKADLGSEKDEELKLLMSNLVTALDILLEGSAKLGRVKRALYSV